MIDREKTKLPKTLRAMQVLQTKGVSDKHVFDAMDEALAECKKQDKENELLVMLKRNMIFVGDISRQHNLLTRMGIVSDCGGAQERVNNRKLLRWWENRLPNDFYSDETLEAVHQFGTIGNLFFNEIKTDDKGKVIGEEHMNFKVDKIAQFTAKKVFKGEDVSLWAKNMPKIFIGAGTSIAETRTTKKTMKVRASVLEKAQKENREASFSYTLPFNTKWVKLNGESINIQKCKLNKSGKPFITVKQGDVVTFARSKQKATLEREKRDLAFVKAISKAMNLPEVERTTKKGEKYIDFVGYRQFRKKQDTIEQKITTKEILDFPKEVFIKAYTNTTAGSQRRLAKMIAYKDKTTGKLKAKTGMWERLGEIYVKK